MIELPIAGPWLMNLLLATSVAVLGTVGLYLVLRARTFETVLGLTLLSYAVNLLLFAMGRLTVGRPPILDTATVPSNPLPAMADPLPQALVLTAIVIGFAMTALLLVLAVRANVEAQSDAADPPDTLVVPDDCIAAGERVAVGERVAPGSHD